jgi:uncharacterized protein
MSSIRDVVMGLPLFDSHDHQSGFRAHTWDDGSKCYEEFLSYATADLAVAGAPFKGIAAGGDPADLFRVWPYVRTTGYGQAVELGCHELFGLDYTEANAPAITEAIAELGRGKTSAQVYDELYARANICGVINDCNHGVPGNLDVLDGGNFPKIFRFVIRFANGHKMGRTPAGGTVECVQKIEEGLDVSITTLADLDAALDLYAQKASEHKQLAGYKIGLAYCRRLDFDETSPAAAEAVFSAMMQDAEDVDLKPLQDYLVHRVMQRADAFGLPVQIHTGYLAGCNQDIRQGDPAPLVPLLKRYGGVQFDIFHAAWPWSEFIGAVGKQFPNVYLDLCWAWAMNPVQMERVLDEWLAAVPCNKIFTFGADTWSPLAVPGYALQARCGIANVLEAKLARGEYDQETAEFVARRIMHENAQEFFGM